MNQVDLESALCRAQECAGRRDRRAASARLSLSGGARVRHSCEGVVNREAVGLLNGRKVFEGFHKLRGDE